jgi:hypothetical protein
MIKASCLALSRMFFWKSNFRGPYFKDYFNQPSRAQIGTMVAILEVGAFCMHLLVYLQQSRHLQLAESAISSDEDGQYGTVH